MHGRQDTVIPFSHGVALHRAAAKGNLIAYEAGHNDCPPDWHVFFEDVSDFLLESSILTPPSAGAKN